MSSAASYRDMAARPLSTRVLLLSCLCLGLAIRFLFDQPEQHALLTLSLFYEPWTALSPYLQLLVLLAVAYMSVMAPTVWMPPRLQFLLRLCLIAAALLRCGAVPNFWRSSDLNPTILWFSCILLVAVVLNRPECGTRRSLNRIGHDLALRLMKSRSKGMWVAAFLLRELLVPEHCAAVVFYFGFRTLFHMLRFFQGYPWPSLLSPTLLYYAPLSAALPLMCCIASWGRLFDETKRTSLYLLTSWFLGALQIAYSLAPVAGVSTLVATKFLLFYVPLPSIALGFAHLYVLLVFSQSDGGNTALGLRLPLEGDRVASEEALGAPKTAMLQTLAYILLGLWSATSSAALANIAAAKFEVGDVAVGFLDHATYWVFLFMMGVGAVLVARALTGAARLSAARQLTWRGCAAETEGFHEDLLPAMESLKDVLASLVRVVEFVRGNFRSHSTDSTEAATPGQEEAAEEGEGGGGGQETGSDRQTGGSSHARQHSSSRMSMQTLFDLLPQNLPQLSKFASDLQVSQTLYPLVPRDVLQRVAHLPKLKVSLQYLATRPSTAHDSGTLPAFLKQLLMRLERIVVDARLGPIYFFLKHFFQGGKDSSYRTVNVLDVLVQSGLEAEKVGAGKAEALAPPPQGVGCRKKDKDGQRAESYEPTDATARPRKTLKTSITLHLGKVNPQAMYSAVQSLLTSLPTYTTADLFSPLRLRVMVEVAADGGKLCVGLPFLSSHLASGGVGTPTRQDIRVCLEKMATTVRYSIAHMSEPGGTSGSTAKALAPLTHFTKQLRNLDAYLRRMKTGNRAVDPFDHAELMIIFFRLVLAAYEEFPDKSRGTLLHYQYPRELLVEVFEDCLSFYSSIFLRDIHQMSETSAHGILEGMQAFTTFGLPFALLFWKVYFGKSLVALEESIKRGAAVGRDSELNWEEILHGSSLQHLQCPFPHKQSTRVPDNGWAAADEEVVKEEMEGRLLGDMIDTVSNLIHKAKPHREETEDDAHQPAHSASTIPSDMQEPAEETKADASYKEHQGAMEASFPLTEDGTRKSSPTIEADEEKEHGEEGSAKRLKEQPWTGKEESQTSTADSPPPPTSTSSHDTVETGIGGAPQQLLESTAVTKQQIKSDGEGVSGQQQQLLLQQPSDEAVRLIVDTEEEEEKGPEMVPSHERDVVNHSSSDDQEGERPRDAAPPETLADPGSASERDEGAEAAGNTHNANAPEAAPQPVDENTNLEVSQESKDPHSASDEDSSSQHPRQGNSNQNASANFDGDVASDVKEEESKLEEKEAFARVYDTVAGLLFDVSSPEKRNFKEAHSLASSQQSPFASSFLRCASTLCNGKTENSKAWTSDNLLTPLLFTVVQALTVESVKADVEKAGILRLKSTQWPQPFSASKRKPSILVKERIKYFEEVAEALRDIEELGNEANLLPTASPHQCIEALKTIASKMEQLESWGYNLDSFRKFGSSFRDTIGDLTELSELPATREAAKEALEASSGGMILSPLAFSPLLKDEDIALPHSFNDFHVLLRVLACRMGPCVVFSRVLEALVLGLRDVGSQPAGVSSETLQQWHAVFDVLKQTEFYKRPFCFSPAWVPGFEAAVAALKALSAHFDTLSLFRDDVEWLGGVMGTPAATLSLPDDEEDVAPQRWFSQLAEMQAAAAAAVANPAEEPVELQGDNGTTGGGGGGGGGGGSGDTSDYNTPEDNERDSRKEGDGEGPC